MLLTIHDANLKKVAFIDNDKQETLNYYDDIWTRSLETGSSTFEFTVYKKAIKSDTAINKTYNLLNERAFVSFRYHGKSYVFNVMTVEENEQTITCYCENLNLELINEYANPYKATKAMSFVEYCNAMDLLNFTHLSVGINEISDQKRTLEWEGRDTKLARLLSLAKKFDAEIDFDTQLNADSSIKSFKVNVYHENDDKHQGVGRVRNDIQLTYGKNLKSITRKIDKTGIYTMVRPYGKKTNGENETIISIGNLSAWSENNADGVREFYQSGDGLYAPLAAQMYPSTFTSGTQADQWIRKDLEVDSDNPTVIRAAGIANLKKNAYPAITYDVDGFIDVDVGDTVKIYDDGFSPILLVEARVSDQKISFTNPNSNKTTFANFKALENNLSDGIQAAFERLFEASKPYLIKLSTDNGVIFKNQIGQSIITPSLYKGGKPVTSGVTWRWSLDGMVTTGMTYTVRGANVTDTATLTIAAYIGNDEVAVDEISFVNVLDGTMGTPGTPGKDGRTPYVHTAWANNATGTSGFSLDNSTNKLYIGIYTDFEPADSTDATKYNWTLIKGEKGEKGDRGIDGLPGKDGMGIKSTAITYGLSTSDSVQPINWTTTVPNLVKGQYLWTKTVWTYSDSTNETGYTKTYIAKDGNSGSDGLPGKDGVGIKTTTITYAKSTNGTTAPSSGWTATVPNVTPGQYLWTKTVWTYTDNTSETGYSVARMGADGSDASINITCGFTQGYADSFTPMNKGIGSITPLSDGWARLLYTNTTSTVQRVEFSLPKPEGLTENQLYTFLLEFRNNKSSFRGIAYFVQDNRSAFWGNLNNTAAASIDQNLVRFSRVPQTSTISLSEATCLAVVNISSYPNQVLDVEFRISAYVGDYKGAYIPYMGGKVGPRGTDGKNAYMHFAFSDNANGVPFSHTDTGQRYQGYYSDNTQAHSGDANRYTWNDRWAKITETTGNLLLKSNETWSSTNYLAKEYALAEPLEEGKTYTFVIHWWRGSEVSSNYVPMIYYNGNSLMLAAPTGTTSWQEVPTQIKYDSEIDSWVVTFTVEKRSQMTQDQLAQFGNTPPKLRVYRFGSDTPNQNASANSSAQSNASFATLVKGNIPMSKWQPHWSELQNDIDSKADQALTQQQLNLLIEKAQLMQTELEAKAAMEALSDLERAYNAYVEANEQSVAKSENDLIETARRVDAIIETLGGLKKTKTFIDTYITEANEGIVIGTNDNVSQIRVTHDRIAMYSAGKEVMYISQGVIHIDNGVFTKSLQIGRFVTSQHETNPDINICRYVG